MPYAPNHNCHHIKSCYPSVKRYILTHRYLSFVTPKSQGQGPACEWLVCEYTTSREVSLSPLLPCSLPSSLNPSSARLLPPLFPSSRPCPVPFLPRSFPSSILDPSLNPIFLHWRSLPAYHHRFLPWSLPPLPPSLPHLPPSLIPSLPHSLPLPPLSLPPSPCSLPPSHPPLASSFPPSILPRSYHAPPCLTVYRRPIQRRPTPCVCVRWRAALSRSCCIAPIDAWHWVNGAYS